MSALDHGVLRSLGGHQAISPVIPAVDFGPGAISKPFTLAARGLDCSLVLKGGVSRSFDRYPATFETSSWAMEVHEGCPPHVRVHARLAAGVPASSVAPTTVLPVQASESAQCPSFAPRACVSRPPGRRLWPRADRRAYSIDRFPVPPPRALISQPSFQHRQHLYSAHATG